MQGYFYPTKNKANMKPVLIAISFAIMSLGSFAQSEMEFESESHDFGDVKFEVPATYKFEFTNEGSAPLIISGAEGSCGCTVPEYPKAPIMPGKKGEITVTYDAKSKGPFQKSVTVNSNDPESPTTLRIKGNVVDSDL
jgi:hypothetical protein